MLSTPGIFGNCRIMTILHFDWFSCGLWGACFFVVVCFNRVVLLICFCVRRSPAVAVGSGENLVPDRHCSLLVLPEFIGLRKPLQQMFCKALYARNIFGVYIYAPTLRWAKG